MRIEEIIKVLVTERTCVERQSGRGCDRACERCDLVLEDKAVLGAYDAAVALLKTHPEVQPNEPMTQKDLLGMDGKWVWLTDHIGGKVIGWGRVYETSIQAVDGWLDVEDCGVEFDAYLRPPKEDADE